MLRIVNVPSNLSYCNNPKSANEFIKSKKQMVNILTHNLVSNYPEYNDIKSSCLMHLLHLYQVNPNKSDGYYFIAIKNHIINVRKNLKAQSNNKTFESEFDIIDAQATDMFLKLDQKMYFQKIESHLSEQSKQFLMLSFMNSVRVNKKTNANSKNTKYHSRGSFRRYLQKKYNYTTEQLRSIDKEISNVIKNFKNLKFNTLVPQYNEISNLIDSEI